MKIIIIGGGFFGVYLAEYLALKGHTVKLVERNSELMQRASYHNQARIHCGYHYPRSILTALRSRMSFPKFVDEFADAVVSDFEKYYFIGKPLSKVSVNQFKIFCQRIGAFCEVAPSRIQALVNSHYIEACFSTVEYAFDATVLRDIMQKRLVAAGVEIHLDTQANQVKRDSDQLVLTTVGPDGRIDEPSVDHIFNCTYSNLNYLLANSGLPAIHLKHELTEMCVVEVPEVIKNTGLTVMCGPFFSVMPFPPLNLHSFSHVRYTPHYQWLDDGDRKREFLVPQPRTSAWKHMKKDAARYMPILNDCVYKKSLWEVKTVLPRSEVNDSRPILFRPNHGLPGLHSVVGGKIDNVYDVITAIESQGICI